MDARVTVGACVFLLGCAFFVATIAFACFVFIPQHTRKNAKICITLDVMAMILFYLHMQINAGL